MNLVQLVRSGHGSESRYSLEQYISDVHNAWYSGSGLIQTYTDKQGRKTESADGAFESVVGNVYKRNGVVFACQLARLLLFTEARFQWQPLRSGRPGKLFGNPDLRILERPWPNGSTGELLARMIQDVDLAGNAYVRRTGPLAEQRLERLRPDWVSIVLGSNSDLLNAEVVGYLFHPGGIARGRDPIVLSRGEVAHWSPIPDPVATYRGMSWLSTVLSEIAADEAATTHKGKFFTQGGTPNMIIKFAKEIGPQELEKFKALMEADNIGVSNAYKNLYLGGGADATVVGSHFEQMDFKNVQGAGETRIAAAAGVPPVIVGLSEGLQAATYSNYAQARRRFADMTIRPLWRSCCAALEAIVPAGPGSRLWYDDRDIPALQEDEKDAVGIEQIKATTITAYVREGFTAASAVAAVAAQDVELLEHTGALSVQLVEPGSNPNGQALNGQAKQGVNA